MLRNFIKKIATKIFRWAYKLKGDENNGKI